MLSPVARVGDILQFFHLASDWGQTCIDYIVLINDTDHYSMAWFWFIFFLGWNVWFFFFLWKSKDTYYSNGWVSNIMKLEVWGVSYSHIFDMSWENFHQRYFKTMWSSTFLPSLIKITLQEFSLPDDWFIPAPGTIDCSWKLFGLLEVISMHGWSMNRFLKQCGFTVCRNLIFNNLVLSLFPNLVSV